MVERRSIQAGGRRLSYLEKGRRVAGEPSLVLIHGLMGTAATFLPLMAEIAEDRHVIALDLPGAGGSERDPARAKNSKSGASLAAVTGSVLKALDALKLERPVLVGHSHGGSVAMYLAAFHPDRPSGLVLISPAHPYFRHADQLIGFYSSGIGAKYFREREALDRQELDLASAWSDQVTPRVLEKVRASMNAGKGKPQ